MNLPNKLTISRIVLAFIFTVFLFIPGPVYKVLAIITFLAAAATDYLDGYIAKHRGLTSDFGKFMDPVADKVLVLAAFIAFVEMGIMPAWMVIVVVFREFIVTGLRVAAVGKKRVIAAAAFGKLKTVLQMATIFTTLIFIFKCETESVLMFQSRFKASIDILMYVTVIVTAISGLSVFLKNRDLIHEKRIR